LDFWKHVLSSVKATQENVSLFKMLICRLAVGIAEPGPVRKGFIIQTAKYRNGSYIRDENAIEKTIP